MFTIIEWPSTHHNLLISETTRIICTTTVGIQYQHNKTFGFNISLYIVITVKNNRAIVIYDNSTFNTSITGLLPNTTYTCCVLAVTSYGESEPVCQNITITNVTSECILYCLFDVIGWTIWYIKLYNYYKTTTTKHKIF